MGAQPQQQFIDQENAAKNVNDAIKSGDVAAVEKASPGYTLYNGAFMQKSQVPIAQANGSTVKDGNVVGPDVPGLGGVPMTAEQKAAVAPNAPGQPVKTNQPNPQTVVGKDGIGGSGATNITSGTVGGQDSGGSTASPYEKGFNAATNAGVSNPSSPGNARTVVSTYADQNSTQSNPNVDNFLSTNPFIQQTNKQLMDFISPQSTRDSIQGYVDQLATDRTELTGLKTELMNNKRIIEGTSDDIRNEVTKANGFATESQVQALALARNKTLISRNAQLTDLIQSQQDAVNTDTSLLSSEKQLAQNETSNRMSILKYQQDNTQFMFNAANDTYKTLMDKNPDALYKSLKDDPTQAERFTAITGLGLDTVKGIVENQKAAQFKATLENQKLQAEIGKTNLETKKLQNEINVANNLNNGPPLPQVNMTGTGTPSKVGQMAFLEALPGGASGDLATQIKGLATYTINPNTFTVRNYKGIGTPTRADLITKTKQYDPSYDETQYSTRQSTRTDFASGKSGQSIQFLNTAVGHIADIFSNTKNLSNFGGLLTGLNWGKNTLATLTGSGGPGKANLNIHAATGELAKLFTGVGATKEELQNLGSINANSSPDTIKQYIEGASQLLGSKLNALNDNYTRVMGRAPDKPLLSSTSVTQLLNLKNSGFNIDVPELQNAPQIKLQTFHDASAQNQQLIDGIVKNHPEFRTNPDAMIDYMAQNGVEIQ